MLISVITPTYNSAATLQACIDSVAAQTHRPIEHIFVDGVSKDRTAEIVAAAQLKHPHIRFLSERDAGIYDAMNKGLSLARGDYVYFLGSDDTLYSPTVLAEMFAGMSAPGDAVLYGNVKVTGGDIHGAKEGSLYDGAFTFGKLLTRNICHQAIFYPRSLVSAAGPYNLKYPVAADWDYNLRAFALCPFEYKDVTVACYNATGLSNTRADLAFTYHFAAELRNYYGASMFNRRFKEAYKTFGAAGFMRLREKRLSGLRYLTAACLHSPGYSVEVVRTIGRWLGIGRTTS